MATAFVQHPATFEPGDNPQRGWEDWKNAYNIYEQACKYATKANAARKVLLLHVLRPHGCRIAQTFLPQPPRANPAHRRIGLPISSSSLTLTKPYKNVIKPSTVLNCMQQKENHSFLTPLRIPPPAGSSIIYPEGSSQRHLCRPTTTFFTE